MTPVRLRYLSEDCHDAIVDHFARSCPVALCQADADAFFAVLCRLIDREIERAVQEVGSGEGGPGLRGGNEPGIRYRSD
jgi:hypothetical protein